VGKTQLAIELAYQRKYKDFLVFWIPATDLESLYQAYLHIAEKLSLPGWNSDGIDVKQLVQRYLNSSTDPWLLIFDNADDINMWNEKPPGFDCCLVDCLPKNPHGSIIFTSRNRKTALKLADVVVEVAEMNEEAANALLQKCLIHSDLATDSSANALLVQLTYLPLAIVQSSAYINRNGISITDYISLLAESDKDTIELLSEDFEDAGRYKTKNIKNPVATTWLISFKQILQQDPLAADYLSFMACLEPKDISVSLLPMAASSKEQVDAIGTLDAYSFVTRRPANTAFSSQRFDLHRLVHLAMRNWLMETGQMMEWASRAVSRISEVFPNNDHENRAMWRAYLPHASCALFSVGQNRDFYLELLRKLGLCLLSDGRFSEAESYLTEIIESRRKECEADHPDMLMDVSNLAAVLEGQGKYGKAEVLNRQVLVARESILGVEHLDTLTSAKGLALVLYRQGKYEEAEVLSRQVLIGREKIDPDHRDTLISINELAVVVERQGKFEEAETLLRQALTRQEIVLGVKHLDTLTSVSNLAGVLERRGKYKEGEALNRQALAAREIILGIEHPDTLSSVTNLALLLERQGEYQEAEALNRRALEGTKKILGVDHPNTFICINNLALVLERQGKYEEAKILNQQALAGRKKVLGVEDPDHPDILMSMSNLAWVLERQGQYKEAQKLCQQALAVKEKVLGAEHPDTLISVYSLACLLHNTKKYRRATKLYQRACLGFERSLGQNHPTTISCLNSYADLKKCR
jgi:tetratricopeptide (TPR) repeat protein